MVAENGPATAAGFPGLAGKVAIVTGSSRGIGRAVAEGFAAAGAAVVVCSPDLPACEAVAARAVAAGGTAVAVEVDVSSRASCERLVEEVADRLGEPDVVVCNAGVDTIRPAEAYEEADWDRILGVNLKGCFNTAQLAARRMLAAGRGGSIVMVGSIAGAVGVAGLAPYSASKGGLHTLARTLAVEWAPRGIRVNCVAPGYVDNVMDGVTAHADEAGVARILARTPAGRRAKLEEIVGPVLFLASDAAAYINGAVLFVDGGYTAA